MSQIVKLRRSSVSGQKPTNSNLQLGELALNTTDGKVYMAKSGSLGPSVEELITTNTVNTGSLSITGAITGSIFTGSFKGDGSQLYNIPSINTSSFATTGSNIFKGNQTVTGSLRTSGSNELVGNTILSGTLQIQGQYPSSAGSQSVSIVGNVDMDGYLRFDPVSSTIDTSISGAYIYVTSSTGDLYFAQNIKGFNNSTRLRWLEGNMYTGLLSGGILSATPGSTTFTLAAGTGLFVELNASLTDDPYPTTKYVEWPTLTGQTLTNLTSSIQTFVGINKSGQIHQQTTAFNDGQYNDIVTIGTIIHQNLSTVNASITYPNVAYGYKQRTYDFIKAFGALKLSGLNIVTTNTLSLNVESGTAWADGRNYQNDPNNPSYITDSGTAVSKIFRYYQVSGTTFVRDTNNNLGYTDINPTLYNNNGVLTAVPGTGSGRQFSIQRVYWYPNSATKGIVVYYGNATYESLVSAEANLTYERFVEDENTKQNAIYLGALVVRNDATWTDSTSYAVLNGGIFRNVGGSGGGGSIPTARLTDLLDVDAISPNNSDILVYNESTLKWEHSKSLNGSFNITGSLIVSGSVSGSSLTGSINYTNLTNVPTLVSGSSQIILSGTTGYSTFSSSISSSVGELSSSIATTTNDLDGRLDSIEGVTGSYATTGSNLFKGDQTISGSVIIGTGSLDVISPELLHVENSGSYNIARFDGNHYSYAQVNLQNNNSGSGASADIVITADNGTEFIHFVDLGINSSTYNAGYVGYENDAYLLNAGKDLYVGTVGGGGHPSNLNLFAQNSWENPQIHISGSGQIGFNTSSISDGYQYEFSGSIKGKNNLNIVGSISSSMFTGSFKGDGSQLYNIPASGVTGLSLDKIINGNASASIDDNGFYVNRDVYIDGTITAKEIHTDYVTSSVLFQSGSTKFGNTNDDTHQFTGSLHISDESSNFSIIGNGFGQTSLISPDGALVLTPGIYGVQINGAFPDLKVNGNVIADGTISSSFTGSGAGLYNLPYSGLTGVPTLISGSSQISYTGITNIPNGIVSGSPQISYTGITDVPNGIVSGSSQVIDLGFTTTSSFESFTSSYVTVSSSFDSRINTITGSLNGLTSTFNSYTSSINSFTSSVLLAYQTSSMTVLSSSYAVTASYALNSGGGGGTEGRTARLEQTVVSDTWTFAHNLGEKYPSIEVFDENDYVVIPTNILAVDENNLTITFSHAITGVASATVGGGIPFISGSYNGRVLAVSGSGPTWKEGIISGSLQVSNFGFATTGSNVFKNNQIITGSVSIRNAKMDATCVSLTSNATIFDLSEYDGAIFDYVVKNGGNMRAGTITGVWNGAIANYNETSTVDMGTTSNINFNVTGAGLLTAVITGGTWQVEVFYRAIGCSS